MNILEDCVFEVSGPQGETATKTLPGLVAGICDGTVAELPGLRFHQRAALHTFLAQLAAGTACRVCGGILPKDEAGWRDAFLRVSAGDPAPWDLIPKGDDKAGFMQPVLSPEDLAGMKTFRSPQEMDVLVASKNFVIKSHVIRDPEPQDWIFALISRQTFGTYDGRENFGIARTNGGSGSRSFWSLTSGETFGEHVLRDIEILIAERLAVERGDRPDSPLSNFKADGLFLTWMRPWDTDEQIDPFQCDPFFIEVSRRIRFTGSSDAITVLRAGSKKARMINPTNGVYGDAWYPVTGKGGDLKALTMSDMGLTSRLICQVMFGLDGRFTIPLCAKPRKNETGLRLVAACLVGGQGKTGGYHDCEIPIPDGIIRLFDLPDAKEALAQEAERLLKEDSHVCASVRTSMRVLFNSGEKPDPKRLIAAADAAQSRISAELERDFFIRLGRRSDPELKSNDIRRVCRKARRLIEDWIENSPVASSKRVKARHYAMKSFMGYLLTPEGPIRKSCPDVFGPEKSSEGSATATEEMAHV
jgi:CRISPR system Cascade subunit CasA